MTMIFIEYHNLFSINMFSVTLELFCHINDCREMFLQRLNLRNRMLSYVNVYDVNMSVF